MLLGIAEHFLTETYAANPTPGYDMTTAIDWENWGVTEAREDNSETEVKQENVWHHQIPDATTAYSIINLHDLTWTTQPPIAQNKRPTSFEDLVATTQGVSVDPTTVPGDTVAKTTSLFDLLGGIWTTTSTPDVTTAFELDLLTTVKTISETTSSDEDLVVQTTQPPLPIISTVATTETNMTEVVTMDEIVTTRQPISENTTTYNNQETTQAELRNGSLLWLQLHPVGDRVDNAEVSENNIPSEKTSIVDETDVIFEENELHDDIQYEDIPSKSEQPDEVTNVDNSTIVETNNENVEIDVNPKIISTASAGSLAPTICLTLMSFLLNH